jgi:hypothetical protein
MDSWDSLHNRVCRILEDGPPGTPPSPEAIKKAILLLAAEIDRRTANDPR